MRCVPTGRTACGLEPSRAFICTMSVKMYFSLSACVLSTVWSSQDASPVYLRTADGKIWIGTEAQGFFIYHPEDGELEQNSRLADAVTDMVGGPDWNVFVSARNGTVAEFDSEGKQRLAVYSKEQGGHVPSIRSLCYSNDELWGCFETDGLAKMTWSGDSAAKWTHRRDLSAQVLLPLSRGELMIGSDDGLFVYYTGSGQVDPVTDMTARGENYTHTVNALYRDREGGIWVATQYNGITYLPRRLKPIEHMSLRIAEEG